MAASLLFGMRADSRIKRKISGQKLTLTEMLLAECADHLAFLSWAQTTDAQNGMNRPKSILKQLLDEPIERDTETFVDAESFERRWSDIVGQIKGGGEDG